MNPWTNDGPQLVRGITSCIGCKHQRWYHCGHPGAPDGTDEAGHLLSMLPSGVPTPMPPWCPVLRAMERENDETAQTVGWLMLQKLTVY